jgi:autotransporter-associated beta strand protein
MTHRTRAFSAAPISSAKQTGIRQRSLRKHCRLGRATELVFITAFGAAVMIGGGASAQDFIYADGQDNAGTLSTDATGVSNLTVNGTDSATQSGVVSGAGDVRKRGTGTLTLSGANTYTGETLIFDGTLDVTGSIASSEITLNGGTRLIVYGASIGNSARVNVSNGTLELRGNEQVGYVRDDIGDGTIQLGANTLTLSSGFSDFNGTVSGTGGLSVTGGTHAFSRGTNFTGAINVTGGSAVFGGTASTDVTVSMNGELWGTLNAGANLTLADAGRFSNGNTQTIASLTQSGLSNLQGDRNLTISGAYDLSGGSVTNSATITAGTFTMSGGTINSGATVNSGGTKTLSGGTIAGTLGGAGATSVTGNVVVSGTLSGSTTTITAGRLAVNGSITSASTVNSGGTLGGTGTVGAVTVNAGGRLAAGNSIGTLNTSSVTLNAGAILEVEVDPSDAARADLINVTGDFTINGATLRHIGEAGTYVPSRTWRIVTTTGAVSGTFGTVTSDYTFLDPTAIYGTNFVDLRLMRNDVSFESIARTRNQRATAGGIGTIGGSEVSNTLVTLSGDAARDALDQFSGAGLAAIGSGQLGEGQGMVDTLAGQMGGTGGGIVTASSRGTGGAAPLWANLYGTGASRDVDGITTDLRNGGVMIGHDLDFGSWQGGVMVGFGQSRTDTTTLRTTSKTDSFSLGTYAARSFGEMDVNLGLIATWGDVQSTRTLAVGALNQTLQASYSTRMLTGFGEVARRFEGAVWSATPFARLTQQWLQNDGVAETGGTAALTREAETTNQTLLSLGTEVERALGIGTLSANFALTQSFGAGAQATYRLGNSTPFTIEGDAARDTSVDLGLGYDITLSNAATLSLTAGTTRQGETNTRRVGVNLGMRF